MPAKANIRLITAALLLGTFSMPSSADWELIGFVEVIPPNPTSVDVVTITIGGWWGSSCIPRDSAISSVGSNIYFDVIWDYPPGIVCLTVMMQWERTESIGPLSPDTYTVYARVVSYDFIPETYIQLTEFVVLGPIIYVDSFASGANDGSSWANAFNYLQDALSVAEYGDWIWVAEGTYIPDRTSTDPNGTSDRAATFQLKNGVGMYGGFPTGGGDWQDRDPNLYETILSGDIAGDDIIDPNKTENSYHVVTASGTDPNTVLNGFIITAGNANGPEPHSYGAGIYNNSGNLQILNCRIFNNSAGNFNIDGYPFIKYPGKGGGMYNYSSSPRITNCQFINNWVLESGGAIYNDAGSSPILTNCIFTDNSGGLARTISIGPVQTTIVAFGKAGAMYNTAQSSPTLTNCTFEGNSTVESGGAMVNIDSSPTIINCMFNRNMVSGDFTGYSWPFEFGTGGGIVNYNSSPEISNCTFTNNQAGNGGGIYNDPNSWPVVTDCTFTENIASYFEFIQIGLEQFVTVIAGSGGGICNTGSNPIVTNCTFSANQALVDGGGMSNYESSPTVTNCSFTGNEAGNGAGMYNDSNSCPIVTDCTFSENLASFSATFMIGLEQSVTVIEGGGGGIYNSGSSPTVANCTFSGNSALLNGGGMSNTSSTPIITNCTFTGNRAKGYTEKVPPPFSRYSFHLPGVGGAIHNAASEPVFTNCTFAANRAENGNAISYVSSDNWQSSLPSNVQLVNCILWDGGDEVYNNDGSTITITYSDVDGGWPGEGNIDADPCFVDPGYWDPNDTPADPNDDFWVDGDYHLKWLSPCFNAGDPNRDYTGQTDMDGNPRVRYGRVDMGAYEVFPLGCDFEPDGDVDLADFAIFSAVWNVQDCNGPADFSGNCLVDMSDLLIFAEYWLAGAGETMAVELTLDNIWMYQNLPGQTNSNLTADVLITDDPLSNSSYTYEWEIILPTDVSVTPTIIDGGTADDAFCTFAAPNCSEPNNLSGSGQPFSVKVTVTGNDFGNLSQAEARFGIAMLGDVNNDTVVNVADRSIINAFWQGSFAGDYTLRDCDLNCDVAVNVADRSIANAVWRGVLCQNSVSNPCPFR